MIVYVTTLTGWNIPLTLDENALISDLYQAMPKNKWIDESHHLYYKKTKIYRWQKLSEIFTQEDLEKQEAKMFALLYYSPADILKREPVRVAKRVNIIEDLPLNESIVQYQLKDKPPGTYCVWVEKKSSDKFDLHCSYVNENTEIHHKIIVSDCENINAYRNTFTISEGIKFKGLKKELSASEFELKQDKTSQVNDEQYTSLFDMVAGSISADTKTRQFRIYARQLLNELKEDSQVSNLSEILIQLTNQNLNNHDILDARFDELKSFIQYRPNGTFSILEKNAWIQAAILDWLWEERKTTANFPCDITWFKKKQKELAALINRESKNNPIENSSNSTSTFYPTKKLYHLHNELLKILKSLFAQDFSLLTRVGDVPKGISVFRTISSLDLSSDKILEKIQSQSTLSRSQSSIGFFCKRVFWGRDPQIDTLYHVLATIDLSNPQSLKAVKNHAEALIEQLYEVNAPREIKITNKIT